MEFTYDIATLAAIVAALRGVAKGFGIPTKYAPLAAMAFSGLFVFLPDGALKANLLTTAGAYSYVKPDSSDGKSK